MDPQLVVEKYTLLRFIALLPLLGAIFNGVLGNRVGRKTVHIVGCGVIGLAFLLSLITFFEVSNTAGTGLLNDTLWNWFNIGRFHADMAFAVDRLNAVMLLVITGIGFLIHVYSTGYMAHDESFARYFAYLNLFCFSMLVLVMGANIPMMFVGWEGVGLCSYLLIGFWFEDDAKASAGKKAFIVNRIGDFGFLLGIFLLFWSSVDLGHPTLSFAGLQGISHELGQHTYTLFGIHFHVATLACLCFLVGAMGKSAQIPLYVWLPDAMAGPTPVSALIHAATMVTAGVYMFCRLNFLLSASPDAMMVIATIGALTALFAATIGIVQNDIKKVLAYSTVSQLGYMFLAVGMGAYTAAMFHLVTHAFFKACLFLGSGSVILGMHHEQDIRKMGGLRKKMPWTYRTFGWATIAIAGIPPLSGFFSKDEILWSTFNGHGAYFKVLWGIGMLAAFCTAFYMARLVILTFFGKPRMSDEAFEKVHESPPSMTFALIVLAFLAVVGGWMGIPHLSQIEHWLAPIWAHPHIIDAPFKLELALMAVSSLVAASGLGLAYFLYMKRPELPEKISFRLQRVYQTLLNKYYVDEIYDFFIIRGVKRLANFLWKIIDVKIVDGMVNGTAWAMRGASRFFGMAHTGNAQTYGFFMLFGLAILFMVLKWGRH